MYCCRKIRIIKYNIDNYTETNTFLQKLTFIMNAYYVSDLMVIISYTVCFLILPSKDYIN